MCRWTLGGAVAPILFFFLSDQNNYTISINLLSLARRDRAHRLLGLKGKSFSCTCCRYTIDSPSSLAPKTSCCTVGLFSDYYLLTQWRLVFHQMQHNAKKGETKIIERKIELPGARLKMHLTENENKQIDSSTWLYGD